MSQRSTLNIDDEINSLEMRNDHKGEKENNTKEDLKCGDYDNEDKSDIEIDENTEGSISGEVDNSAEDNFIQDFSPDIPITKQRYHTYDCV